MTAWQIIRAKSEKFTTRIAPNSAAVFLLAVLVIACSKGGVSGPAPVRTDTSIAVSSGFAKGADVSWLSQMEATGYKFYNSSGSQMDGMQLMKTLGINSIRLRAWVNPAGGWNGNADLVAKAIRARNLGMRILIDFHYSDTWADPGHQTKPAAWTNSDFKTLVNNVYTYTVAVLDTLKANGIGPTWVQVGNETSDGMLWEDGRASANMAHYAALVNAGYQAAKSVNDTMKVIVHLHNGFDNNLYRWIFDGLKANGADWDIVGMSLYPTAANWSSYTSQCLANMNDMVSRYNKQVMVCEVGMAADDPSTCLAFLKDIIAKTKSVAGDNGLGVFYWEPEAYNWQNYGLGAFDNSGKPTIAMDAFK